MELDTPTAAPRAPEMHSRATRGARDGGLSRYGQTRRTNTLTDASECSVSLKSPTVKPSPRCEKTKFLKHIQGQNRAERNDQERLQVVKEQN